jgi:hypothetical protein
MARYEHLPIYQKGFELAVYLEQALSTICFELADLDRGVNPAATMSMGQALWAGRLFRHGGPWKKSRSPANSRHLTLGLQTSAETGWRTESFRRPEPRDELRSDDVHGKSYLVGLVAFVRQCILSLLSTKHRGESSNADRRGGTNAS